MIGVRDWRCSRSWSSGPGDRSGRGGRLIQDLIWVIFLACPLDFNLVIADEFSFGINQYTCGPGTGNG